MDPLWAAKQVRSLLLCGSEQDAQGVGQEGGPHQEGPLAHPAALGGYA